MRTFNISMTAVAVLLLSSTFTPTEAARGDRLTTSRETKNHFLAAKKKKHWKSYGYHCPPGQAKKFRC